MNGVHDMGGMTCYGPVQPEDDEPVFHSDWERRVFAMNIASLAFFGPIDRVRHAIERMDPLQYLATSYYEHWLAGMEIVAKDLGYLTDEELTSGKVAKTLNSPNTPPDAEMVEKLARGGMLATREDIERKPAFKIGDAVLARNVEIQGHTRLPRYVRGKQGTIEMLHGIHVFPDTVAHDRGENPSPLYCLKFEAKELWGDNVARKDSVYIDLWEDYLQPLDQN